MDGSDSLRALLERVAATEAQLALLTAVRLQQVAAFAIRMQAATPGPPADADLDPGGPAVSGDGIDAAAAELAPRLRMAIGSAYRLGHRAPALTTRLPLTFAALADGRVDQARAAVVAVETEQLSDAGAAIVDEVVVDVLTSSTRGELIERLRTEVAQIANPTARSGSEDQQAPNSDRPGVGSGPPF